MRERQLAEVRLDRPRQPRRRRAARARQIGRGPGRRLLAPVPLGLELGGPRLVALEPREARPGLGPVGDDLREAVAVLPAEVAEELPAAAYRLEPLGVVGDRLGRHPHVVLDVGELGLRGAQTRRDLGERRAPVERGERGTERVERGTLERGVRATERLAMGGGVGEQHLLGLERHFLAGVVELGARDLVHLEAQQVDLARSRARVAAELPRGRPRLDACVRARRGTR